MRLFSDRMTGTAVVRIPWNPHSDACVYHNNNGNNNDNDNDNDNKNDNDNGNDNNNDNVAETRRLEEILVTITTSLEEYESQAAPLLASSKAALAKSARHYCLYHTEHYWLHDVESLTPLPQA